MESISILGIGIISKIGNTIDAIWENLERGIVSNNTVCCSFDSGLSATKKRKANRYSEMGIYVSKEALKDSSINIEMYDKNRIGTIFTTGYGPINSSLTFAKSIAEGDWEYCSPTVFANSVNNACVGHICMELKIRGASTMLMASNNFLYSQLLLTSKKADYIITGSIEEHCAELFNALQKSEFASDLVFNEAAVAFLIGNGKHKNAYCIVEQIEECNIGNYPIINKVNETYVISQLEKMYQKVIKDNEIDVFLGSENGTYFDVIEKTVLQKVLPDGTIHIENTKAFFGETLGSSFNVNVMVAALCLRKGKLPHGYYGENIRVQSVLVSGYDLSGNYSVARLRNGGNYEKIL